MKELDNLVKINKLKPEPPDAQEFAGMVRAAETKLKDAVISELSLDSQFSLAYSAAYALSLAALRWMVTAQKVVILYSNAYSIR